MEFFFKKKKFLMIIYIIKYMVKTLNIFFKYEFYIRKRKRINITKNLKKKKKIFYLFLL